MVELNDNDKTGFMVSNCLVYICGVTRDYKNKIRELNGQIFCAVSEA